MKKLFVLLMCILILVLTGCVSADNVSRDGEREIVLDKQNYRVLGRVQMVLDKGVGIEMPSLPFSKKGSSQYLYYELYNVAKEAYPETDDVMNVTVDYEGTKFLFLRLAGKYVITGLAVDITSTN